MLSFLFSLLLLQASAQEMSRPSAEQIRKMDEKLQSLGLPPGLESWVDDPAQIHEVTLSPPFHQAFVCGEHPAGQLHSAGDALGTDCMIAGGIEGAQGFESFFRGDGKRNEDWYGWRAELHAPVDGVVAYLHINPVTNDPGIMGKPPASMIAFQRGDGVTVVYAHIADPRVKAGDKVTAGQVVALVGNNGMARNPHVHVGAYKGKEPLQIRWDLAAMGQVPALVGN